MKLSKKSKQLMLFFNENKHINIDDFNDNTTFIFKEFYNHIFKAYKFVKNKFHFKTNFKKFINSNQITKPKNFNTKNFPILIRNYIDENMMAEIFYSFYLYNREIKVYFIVENDNPELDFKLYNSYIEIIAMWLYILNFYESKKCVDNISIYLYFTSLEKHLPNSNIHILDEINVNTAFTTTCPRDSEIIIFRKEEWFKVFIHETFHNFGLDFSGMNNTDINNCILHIFPVNSHVNAFETYTEFWAEIINIIFCAFFHSKSKTSFKEFINNIHIYIHFELIYSFFQMVKTLDFMGLTYFNLYSKTEHSNILRLNLYKENTNVLSYYILKTILFNNFQGFFYWCKNNNFSLLDFKKTIGNLNSFCKFITLNYNTHSMLTNIKNTQIFFSKIKQKKSNKFILSNMRMTICELY
jgi:hypothetical protein